MRKIFPILVEEELKKKKELFVLLGDIGVYSFRNVFSKYPQNIENFGVIEQSMISIAAGLSIGGHIPIVHTIAPFIVERAFEQLKIDFGYQNLRGNFISVGGAFDYSGLGSTHHCPGDVNLIKSIPNFQFLMPGHPKEFRDLFKKVHSNNHPSYFRLTETPNSTNVKVKFGKASLIKNDGDLLILVFGDMLDDTLIASKDLPVTILYYTTLEPFDTKTLIKYFKGNVLVIGSFYSGVIENDIQKSFKNKKININSLTIPKKFIHRYGSKDQIKNYLGLNKKNILKVIKKLLIHDKNF